MGLAAETNLGGSGGQFPTTVWSSVVSSAGRSRAGWEERLHSLCHLYWRPVYRFIRTSWSRSIEDAKDLTQGFFYQLLRTDFLSKYERAKGRFRPFLKASLKNYLREVHRGNKAAKRGGGADVLSLDGSMFSEEELRPDQGSRSPEEVFDRSWATEVLKNALEHLRRELKEEGKESHWQVYEAYEVSPRAGEMVTYKSVGALLGLSPVQVKNHLDLVRSRIHQIIVSSMSDCVTTPSELIAEMKALFSN